MIEFKKIFGAARLIVIPALLGLLFVLPLSVFAAGTIFNPQATDDSTNVYYSMSKTGSFSNYRVYIDTDQSAGTGYLVNGIGANYMVANGTLNSYSGTGGDWGWTSLVAVTYTNTSGAVSWTVARSAIGKVGNPNAENLVFGADNPTNWLPAFTHTYGAPTPTPVPATATPARTPTAGPSPTPTPTSVGSTTVTYTASTAVITNPERGTDHTNTDC